MVGGWVIEITNDNPAKVWVTNPAEGEICVHVERDPETRMPRLGEEIWWQSRRIMFGGPDPAHGELRLQMVGYSHSPAACRSTPDPSREAEQP